VLAVHSPSAQSYSYPPAEVTDRIFRPQVQGGFGVQLPQYVGEAYEDYGDEGSPPRPVAAHLHRLLPLSGGPLP